MECDDDGLERATEVRGRGVKRKHRSGGAGVVRLAFSAAVPRAAGARAVPGASHEHRAAVPPGPAPPVHKPSDPPFMNNMDEITYWVYTKRAPCLFNYDNTLKKQADQPQPSTANPPSVKNKPDDDQTPRKKRKLKLLDDNSASTEKRQNIYFKTPQIQKPALGSCKSEEHGSDSDFIVPQSTRKTPKNTKLPRNCQSRVLKKTKVPTSTPKAVILRRSCRKAQQNISNLDSSFEIFDTNIVNGNQNAEAKKPDTEPAVRSKVMPPDKGTKDVACNGQFEDLSDVSGFTANYIRSTKLHTKRPQKLNQNSRAPSKHAKPADKIIICQNKAVNTGSPHAAALNCSTDSSQNALHLLVTVRNNEKGASVNKSTSLLKFIETKLEDSKANSKVNKQESKCNLNISFQSRSSGASRYPRRHKNNTADIPVPNCSTNIGNPKPNTTTPRYITRKKTLNSYPKENSREPVVSRTRSGRTRGLKLDDEESGCPDQLNSSMEQVSSNPAVNVACSNTRNMKSTTSRCLRSRTVKVGPVYKDSASEGSDEDGMPRALVQPTPKCVKKVKKTTKESRHSLGDSHRDRSGFTACFSDSGSDSAPLKQKKFFC